MLGSQDHFSALRDADFANAKLTLLLLLAIVLRTVLLPSAARAHADPSPDGETLADADQVFDVPRVEGLVLDGAEKPWANRGYRVDSFACLHGQTWPRSYPPPTMRLGWDDRGLFALIVAHNLYPHEFGYERNLFKGDSVEFFVSTARGSHDRYMLVISPGLDPRYPEVRHCFFFDPAEDGERDTKELTCTIARRRTSDGYTMEVLLPWNNLKIKPADGVQLGLQVYVMDNGGPGECVTSMWHLAGESHINADAVYTVRLAEQPSEPFQISAAIQKRAEKQGSLSVRIVGIGTLTGQKYDVETGNKVFRGLLSPRGHQAYAAVELPALGTCSVNVAGRPIPLAAVPQDNLQDLLTKQIDCNMQPAVFYDTTFPPPTLRASSASAIIKQVSYYDADLTKVDTAPHPGRYGAIVALVIGGETEVRRFLTLRRLPDTVNADGIVPAAPALSPDDVTNDQQWWLRLKRKLYGLDVRYPSAIICPQQIDGPDAPVLREGTSQEAGIRPQTIANLDSLFRFGVQNEGEPLAVCLARHGVIFFHRAYGQADGKPMTIDTPCDVQSQTKTISGALMMMLVDRGLVHLDDPVANFLPPFQSAHKGVALTVRHLYTHLSGFHDSWGDEANDAEEVLGGCYPFLRVGTYCYNGTGFALGSKLIEDISGECIHQFAEAHLLKPLGMSHTVLKGSSTGAQSIPIELARFGQMLLNEGAYGNKRFFSAQTFHQMLPAEGWGTRGGIGLQYGPRNMLGHTAAHSGLFWIDPANQLIVVITSRGNQKVFARLEDEMYDLLFQGFADVPK